MSEKQIKAKRMEMMQDILKRKQEKKEQELMTRIGEESYTENNDMEIIDT